ncbi:MAG: ORF6N domain-containing protein, partial [Verrucomicrobia bacterium]|nr:ORF6N domain-containing protein [Verrucomicrobiota bacterium]
ARKGRGQRVLLDRDLAELYGVPTRQLNQQVKRNLLKFPADFVFILTNDEKAEVVDQLPGLVMSVDPSLLDLPAAGDENGFDPAAQLRVGLGNDRGR